MSDYRQIYDSLDDREKDILNERHGKTKPTNLRTLSEKYGISRERVRQIESAALDKINGVAHFRPAYNTETIERFRPLFMQADATELQIADAIKELISLGVSQKIIAESYGKQETWISFIKKLIDMPDSLLAYLRSKVVKTTALIKAVDQFGTDVTEKTISVILNERKRKGRVQKITQRELFERIEPEKSQKSA
jgi:hypothetical protein